MPEGLAEAIPTGGAVVAPTYLSQDVQEVVEVGGARQLVPSPRELSAGVRHSYVDAVKQAPPPEPPLWEAVKNFVREADPRAITRDAPRFPVYFIAVLTAVAAFDVTTTLGPQIQQDLGLPVYTQAYLASVMGTIGTLTAPLFGYLADHVRRVVLLRIGTVLATVSAIAQSFALGPASYLLLGLGGYADAMIEGPIQGPLMADYYPIGVRIRIFTFIGAVGAFFGLLGPIFGGQVGQALGWRKAVLYWNLVGIPLALGVFLLKEPVRGYQDRKAMGASEEIARRPQPPMSFAESWRAAYAIKTLRLGFFAIPFLAVGGAQGVFAAFYFAQYFHLTPGAIGLIGALNQIPSIPILVLGGVLGDRMLRSSRPGRILVYAQLLAMGSLFLLAVNVLVHNFALSVATGFAFALPTAIVATATGVIGTLVVPARFRATGPTAGLPFYLLGNLVGAVALAYSSYYLGLREAILLMIPILAVGHLILMAQAFTVEPDIRRSLASSMAEEESERARKAGVNKLLVCRDVDIEYGGTQVVFNLDLDVEEGEILALLGTNGSGKSTLLKAISGIIEASNGAIYFDGVDITHQPPHEQAEKGIVMVPGGRAIFPTLTVAENLRTAAWLYRKERDYVASKVDEALRLFPILGERYRERAGNLSGGEQQQLCLAQAFLMKPRLLMIDELTLGLAPQVVEQLLDVIREVNAAGTTVVLVEQSINLALTIAKRAVFMEKGQIRYDGPTKDLLTRSDVARSVFLGEARTSRTLGATSVRSAFSGIANEDESFEHLLEVSDVSVAYGGVNALRGVTFQMSPREVIGIIGPNGAGKTTVFDVISGFVTPPDLRSGSVILAGVDVTKAAPDRRHYVGLCRSFQNVRLFPAMTARETIAVAYERHLSARNPLLAAMWFPAHRQAERKLFRKVDGLIETLGLGAFANKFMDELSTGSRRLVEIACLLAAGPKLLLLDEPSSGLAQAETEELAPIILRIRQETGCGILVVEHDLPLIGAVSDRIVAMELGQVIAAGSPDEVMSDDRVIAGYLGAREDVLLRSGALSRSAEAFLGEDMEVVAVGAAGTRGNGKRNGSINKKRE